jgi:HD-GYP domain-containing protein (c-di-GMP phosphodiesterase class II)
MPRDLRRHSQRVARYAGILARRAMEDGAAGGLTPELVPLLRRAALYHDLGKLMTPARVLYKDRPLSESEWAVMKRHPRDGADLLIRLKTANTPPEDDSFYALACGVILCHHEWWDGRGYPCGLKGANIPPVARICAVADAYDAITARRAYQPALPHAHAGRLIERMSGIQFDPALIETFRRCKDQIEHCLDVACTGA